MHNPDQMPPAFAIPGHLREGVNAFFAAWLSRQGSLWSVKDAATGRYVHANEAMASFLKQPLAQVLGQTDSEWMEASVATALRAAEQTAMAHGAMLSSEHRFEWHGSKVDFSVLRLAVGPNSEGQTWLCSLWVDQSAQRQKDAQLKLALEQLEQQQRANDALRREMSAQAFRDSLTGLNTRNHFDDQLRRELDLSTREQREFALVLMQVDPLPAKVRDRGEAALTRIDEAMGRLVRGNTRAMDASCRIEAGRFAVLLSGVGLATGHARMEGLRRQCATQLVVLDAQELAFSVSVGVASFPHTANTQEALMGACEAALKDAQQRGGNCLRLASISFNAT